MSEEGNPNDVPIIKLGGREFPIPELAVRQLRKVRRPMIDLSNRIIAAGDFDKAFIDFSEEDYDRLLVEPVYWALTRGTKDLTFDQFLDLKISDLELMAAWAVARKQAGAFIAKAEETPDTGEAMAART